MRANVSFGMAGETILQHGLEQKIAEPRHAGPTLCADLTMPSEIEAISPLVDQLMPLIRAGHCVSGDDSDVEAALREALANAVLHGNKRDTRKKVYVSCRIRPGKELSIVIRDEGKGFDPAKIPDPTATDNVNSANGRGYAE
jgi:serine/threonine-protein kinase RsbW